MTTLANPMAGATAPGGLPKAERDLRAAFLEEIDRIPGGGRLNQCIQCGTCTASCPVSYAMDVTPRQVIGMFRAGAIEELLQSRTIWICASCYHCTLRCPAQIQITDLIYALKRIAIEEEIFPKRFPVHVMSETFTRNVKRYGRNYEVGLLLRYFLRTKPLGLFRQRRAGYALWRHGRIRMRPDRIDNIDQLRKIIAKAETFDLPQETVKKEKVTASVGYGSIGR
jgi:heterodisulfide reductase subunit C